MTSSGETERSLEIGRALQLRIRASSLSQKEIEKRIGMANGYLSQLIHGKAELKVVHLLRVLGALEVEPAGFFREIAELPLMRSGAAGGRAAAASGAEELLPGGVRLGDFMTLLDEKVRDAVQARMGELGALAASPERVSDSLVAMTPSQRAGVLPGLSPEKKMEVARCLWERSFEQRHEDAGQMRLLAGLAVEVADLIGGGAEAEPRVEDARAEARIHLANAQRVSGDMREAAATWEAAESCQRAGSGDLLLAAQFNYFKGVFCLGQGKPSEGAELLRDARSLYAELGEHTLALKVQMTQAEASRRSGDLDTAVRLVFAAASEIPVAGHLNSRIGAIHNLVYYLDEAGHSAEALALLAEAAILYDLFPGKLAVLRMRWLEARVARSVGDLDRAERAFRSLSQSFADRAMDFDAAHAALELAVVLAQQDRHAEVAELAEEMYPIFISKDIPREATAALVLFSEAVRREVVSAERIQKLVEKVEAARAGD